MKSPPLVHRQSLSSAPVLPVHRLRPAARFRHGSAAGGYAEKSFSTAADPPARRPMPMAARNRTLGRRKRKEEEEEKKNEYGYLMLGALHSLMPNTTTTDGQTDKWMMMMMMMVMMLVALIPPLVSFLYTPKSKERWNMRLIARGGF